MFDLTVVSQGGLWLLVDDEAGELGSFASRAEALQAAGDYAPARAELRHVLILEPTGEWQEAVIEPPTCH